MLLLLRMTRLSVVLAAMCLAVTGARAQEDWTKTRCKPDATGKAPRGTIRGKAVYDSGARQTDARGIYLAEIRCHVIVEKGGTFEFLDVPVGVHHLNVADLGIRRFDPLELRVGADSTSVVELHLRPENEVADCKALPVCAPLLEPNVLAATLAPAAQLEEASFRTAIALVVSAGWKLGDFTACVDSASTAVLEAMKSVIPGVAPPSACVRPDLRSPVRTPEPRVQTVSGGYAMIIGARVISRRANYATIDVSYYIGPLNAEGWRCTLEWVTSAWVPRECHFTWIS